MKMKMRTALVRNTNGNLKTIHSDDYETQKDFGIDLRGNGYKVLKIWNGYVTDEEADKWELVNRK